MIIFQHADRNPESTGVPALPFEIHRVWLSKIENTFSSCGSLALEKTALHMVDLPHGMPEIVLDIHEFPRCCLRKASSRSVACARSTRSRQHSRYASTCSGRARRVERTRLNSIRLCQNQTAYRVPQKIDVRGIVHVRLHHKGITAPSQPLARLFSRDRMAALHYQLSNFRQQLAHQTHVVHYRLVLVLPLVPDISVNAHHQDPPKLHREGRDPERSAALPRSRLPHRRRPAAPATHRATPHHAPLPHRGHRGP